MSATEVMARPFADRAADVVLPPRDRLADFELSGADLLKIERENLAQKARWSGAVTVAGIAAGSILACAILSDFRRRKRKR